MKIEKIIFKTIVLVLVQVFLIPNIYWTRAAISCPNIYLERDMLSPSLIIGNSFFQINFLNNPRKRWQGTKLVVSSLELEVVEDLDITIKDIRPYVRILYQDFKNSALFSAEDMQREGMEKLEDDLKSLSEEFDALYDLTNTNEYSNQKMLKKMQELLVIYAEIFEKAVSISMLRKKTSSFQIKFKFLEQQLKSFYELCAGKLIMIEGHYTAEAIVDFSKFKEDKLISNLGIEVIVEEDANFGVTFNRYLFKSVLDTLKRIVIETIANKEQINPKIKLEFRQKGETSSIVFSYIGKIAEEELKRDPISGLQRIFLEAENAGGRGFYGLEPDNLRDIINELGGIITAEHSDEFVVFTMSFHPLKRMVAKKLRELKERQSKSLLTNIDDIKKWSSLCVSNFDLWVQLHFDFGEKEVLEKLLKTTNSKGMGYLEEFKDILNFGLPLYNVLFRLVMESGVEEKESEGVSDILSFYTYETDAGKLRKYNNAVLRLVFMYRKEIAELIKAGSAIGRIDFEGIAGNLLGQSI